MRILTSTLTATLIVLGSGCAPKLEGGWSVASSCPKTSPLGEVNVTATAAMREVGENRFEGDIVNSLGQKGTVEATIDDKVLRAKVSWDGSGTTDALLTYDSRTSVFSGTDTEGCTVRVRRPA